MPNSLAKMTGFGVSALAAAAIAGDLSTVLVATGSTQGTAIAVSANYNLFITVAAGTGMILPAIQAVPGLGVTAGDQIAVFNNGANALLVYPPVGSTIGLTAINTAISLPSAKSAVFTMLTNTIWGVTVSA